MALQNFSERTVQARILIITANPSDALSRGVLNVISSETNISTRILQYRTESSSEDLSTLDLGMDFNKIDVALLVATQSQLLQSLGIISAVKGKRAETPVIIVKDSGTPEEIMEYCKIGASDYIFAPLRAIDILPRIWRLIDYSRQGATLVHKIKLHIGLKQLVGKSPPFLAVIEKIPAIAQSDVGVQISGETGTGKELCARAIHYLGPRAGKPFLPVNCGAIPSELVENELFGHVRGAFTGATLSHCGLIGEANGGTLFLDEIDCLPLQAQVKLLRLLQEKEYRQLGSTKVRQADVRIIAAANIDLEIAMHDGTFRQDLFYRLNIVHLMLPALRERREDIPLLARHFLDEFAEGEKRDVKDFTPEAMDTLCRYNWSGNIRELENVIKRAMIFTKGNLIQAEDFGLPRSEQFALRESFQSEKARVVIEFENRYIREILQSCRGNIAKAAQTAGKNRRAFWELIRKHNIDVKKFKPYHPEIRISSSPAGTKLS